MTIKEHFLKLYLETMVVELSLGNSGYLVLLFQLGKNVAYFSLQISEFAHRSEIS